MKFTDGPVSPHFIPAAFAGQVDLSRLHTDHRVSEAMAEAAVHAPTGQCTAWGIPFQIGPVYVLVDTAPVVDIALTPLKAGWLIFQHTSDYRPLTLDASGFHSPMRGEGMLKEHAADYVIIYADGTEERQPIRRRFETGMFHRRWGEHSFLSVAASKPHPVLASHEQTSPNWGESQTRVDPADHLPWMNWLYAWQNPHPEKEIVGLRCQALCGVMVLSAVTAGMVEEHPLRWRSRRKAVLRLPEGEAFSNRLDGAGMLDQIQLDMGQVISTQRASLYPNLAWAATFNNQLPTPAESEVLVEYTCHPQACFHLPGGRMVSASQVEAGGDGELALQPVPPAARRVNLKVVQRGSKAPVPVKLHVHGAWGEYLPPVDRHRMPNTAWFEDYSVDFVHQELHPCTYISGETLIDLPLGPVYIEVSKGFEIRPLRLVAEIGPDTEEVLVEVEKVLPWRERGWVSADTHVHFLSPNSALLEGAAEGVNVINLLASQWGELMTNVGDFDGRSTWGSKETGGDGEHLVRVGTENRQHILGHISLLGYRGRIIAPMTTGGPDESALGDPIETLLTEWARRCRQQGGLVVLPHFPNPRAEHAASIVRGEVDAIEMTSWGNLYSGISPYSLSDWYRYLNCGYQVAAVGGTDKMSANTAVGTVRTYAHLPADQPFTYEAWMDAVRRGRTFVTYGPLLEFSVEGQPAGARMDLGPGGGTLDVSWQVASVTIPVSRVELIVNGEIRESLPVDGAEKSGSWHFRVEKSCWLALLVRGQYPGFPEVIAAHSSAVMVDVASAPLLAAGDAVTILEQIEGAMAYLEVLGTRPEAQAYKRMRLELVAAHRHLHNRLHQMGYYHHHTPLDDHLEHR